MSRKIANVRSKVNIIGYGEQYGGGYIERADGNRVYLYSFEPSNLAVLSEDNIRTKVRALADIENTMSRIEFLALDDRQNLSKNRAFIQKRLEQETNPAIRQLLFLDLQDIKQKEADSASARRYLIGFRMLKSELTTIKTTLSAIQAALSHHLMRVYPLTKEEIQELIAMYFMQDTTTPSGMFEDFDGESYFKDKDVAKLSETIERGGYSKPVADFDFSSLYNRKDSDTNAG